MTVDSPDPVTVQAALSLATRAPSLHNSQPWRWRVGPRSLHLYADRSSQLAHNDPDGRNLLVNCGAALNHCAVALAGLGWQPRIRLLPDPADDDHLASIEYRRYQPAEVDIALAAAIPSRRTDRRPYSPWPVPMGHIATMGARAARMGVTMRRVETGAGLRSFVQQAMSSRQLDAGYLGELTAWAVRPAPVTDVPAQNVPDAASGGAAGGLSAGAEPEPPAETTEEPDNGVLLALGTAEDDALARLRAGEATSQILLTATSVGLASCMLTEQLAVPQTRDTLHTTVFDIAHFPQMLLHVGWPPINADPLPATPRRPLGDVVCMLDGSPFDPVGQ